MVDGRKLVRVNFSCVTHRVAAAQEPGGSVPATRSPNSRSALSGLEMAMTNRRSTAQVAKGADAELNGRTEPELSKR